MEKNLLAKGFRKLTLLVAFLTITLWANSQTTIGSGTTTLASTIPANTTVTINAGGTLSMDQPKTFTSITSSGSGTSTITGTGILTTNAITIAPGNTNTNTLTVSSNSTVICTSIALGAGNGSSKYKLVVSGILKNSGTTASLDAFTCNAGSTVEYNGAAQIVFPTTYSNLTLSGSGIKALSSSTVNAILSMQGTATASGTISYGSASTLEYKGSAAQTTGNEFVTPFPGSGGVVINNASGVTLSSAKSVGANPFTIGSTVSGSVFNDGGFQLTSNNGTLNFTSGTFNIGLNSTATTYPGFTTNTIASGTTVNYNSSTSQTIAAVNYGNLTNAGNGPRILASSGTIGIQNGFTPSTNASSTITGSTVNFYGTGQTIPAFNYNNLSVATGSAASITLPNIGIIGIAGLFNPGSATTFGTITSSTVSLNGSTAQTLPAFTFNSLTINNAAGISSLGGDVTVNQSLALTKGVITTGSSKVIIPAGGSVSPSPHTAGNGWIAGNLQKYFSLTTTGQITYEIGDATSYRPVTINFSSITAPGYLTAFVTQADAQHPQIATSGLDNSKTVKRYWNLTSTGLAGTYDATFNYVSADVQGNTANYVVRNYNNPTWITTTTGAKNSTSTQATGLTTFGDFAIGEKYPNPIVSTPPANISVCAGNNASFTSVGSASPTPAVKWQLSTDAGATFTDIADGGVYSNSTTSTLNITGAAIAMNGYKYRSVYTNINGSATATAATLTVTTPPSATINYPGSPFASTDNAAEPVTLTGSTGGTYTASPGGLSLNGSSGAVTPNLSTVGTYTVTYTIAAVAGGCGAFTTTATVKITLAPTATISYAGNPFCQSVATAQHVTRTGTGSYTGGNYSYTNASNSQTGLTFDAGNGDITPGTSTPDTYTITYNIPASAPYPASTTTTTVTITAVPNVTFNYTGSQFCTSDQTPQTVTYTGGVGAWQNGTFTATPSNGLVIDAGSGAITPSGSTAGNYTITYTIPATGGCSPVTKTIPITIVAQSSGSISYTGSPFCKATTTATVTKGSGTPAGMFSYSSSDASAVLSMDASGTINPSASTPGDYTVIYTIAASGPCGIVQLTTPVSIVASPTGSISYDGTPFCQAGGVKQVTYGSDVTGLYTGGTFSATPSGLTINTNTGAINPTSSQPGAYTISYTTPNCPVTSTTSVQITAAPTATISYAGTPFCLSDGTIRKVTFSGDNSGTFSAPAGLSVNSANGDITPSTSAAGTYNVSYIIPATTTCAAVTVTTSVTITAPPTATISYAGTPFCKSLTTAQPVSLSGTNAYMGGIYSSTSGLIISSSNGSITPSGSTPGTYTVTYTLNAAGGCSAVIATTTVTITAVPTASISYPGPFCISDASTYSVNLSGAGAYANGTFTSSPAGLAIDGSGNITPSGSTAGTYTVTYTIPASGGCATVPVTTTVTINPLPVITSSASGTICSGVAQNYTITSSLSGTTYSWSRGAVAGISNSAVSGQTNNTITEALVNSTSSPIDVAYSITPTAAGCAGNSFTYTVTVNPSPVVTTSNTAVICSGTATNLALTANIASNFTWTVGTVTGSITGASSGSGSTINQTLTNPGNSAAGTVQYIVTPTSTTSACAGIPYTITVTVNPKPAVTTASTKSICNGSGTNITLTASATSTYTWTIGTITGGITGANSGSGSTISDVLTNPGNSAAGTVQYLVTPTSSAGCTGNAYTITVTVNPTPAITSAATGAVCSGAAQNYTIVGSVSPGTTFSWSRATVTGVSNGAVSGQTSIIITEALTNTTALPVNVVYVITPTANSCTGNPFNYTVTVNPVSVGGTIASNQIICKDATPADLKLSGNVGSVTKWQSAKDPGFTTTITDYANTTTTLPGLTIGSLTTTTYFRAMVTSGTCSSIFSSVANVAVNPPFTPVITATPGAICSGQSVTFTSAGFSTADTLTSGEFSSPKPSGWSGYNGNASNDNTTSNTWGLTNGPRKFGTYTYSSNDQTSFMIVNGNIGTSVLTTKGFSTVGRTSVSLEWYQSYNFENGSTGKVEISIDGGTTFTTLVSYSSGSVLLPSNPFTTKSTINLNAYLGQPNVIIHFSYNGASGTNSAWAIDNVGVVGPYQPITYSWPSGFTVDASGASATITLTTPGTKTYTIPTSTGNCVTNNVSVSVIVNPLPTISPASSAASVCNSATVQTTSLSYTATNSPTTYSITWNATPANTFASISNASLPANSIQITVPAGTAPGTYTGTVTVTNGNNCASSSGATFTITVNPNPTVNAGPPVTAICQGGTTVALGGSYGGGATGAIWTAGGAGGTFTNNGGATPNTATYTASATATSPVTLTLTTSGGSCGVVSASKTVTVNPNPTVNAGPVVTAICQAGTTVALGGSFGGGATGAVWSDGSAGGTFTNNAGTTPNTATYTASATATSPVTLTLTTSGGSCGIVSASKTVTVNPNATITLTSGAGTNAQTPCINSPITNIIYNIAGGGTGFTMTGTFPPGVVGNYNSGVFTISGTPTASGTFNYTITTTGTCTQTSASGTITVNYITWTGTTSVDWNLGSNWSCGNKPLATDDVIIPVTGVTNMPKLTSTTTVRSLTTQAGATVTLGGQTFNINGNVGGGGKFISDVSASMLLGGAGSGTLNFDQTANGTTNAIKNLTVNTTSASPFLLGSDLYIINSLTLNGGELNSAGHLTIRSTSNAATAYVAPVTNGAKITGDVTVERFIPQRRAFRFLSPAVTTTTSIKANWMENAVNAGVYPPVNNPNPGFGTNITGPNPTANGFDPTITNNPSMFTFNSSGSNQAWTSVTNTNGILKAGDAYRLIVRGSRSTDMSDPTNAPPPTNTTLRAKGKLFTGDYTPVLSTIIGGSTFIGNPYASPVDFQKMVAASQSISTTYAAWDPNLNDRGAYVYYNASNNTNSTIGLLSKVDKNIQSGQAVFTVTTGSSPFIQFKEEYKSVGNTNVFRVASERPQLAVQLLLNLDSGPQNSADAVAIVFDDAFSTSIGDKDSRKFSNLDENMAINHRDTLLSIEGRPTINSDDTIHLKLWQFRKQDYYIRLKSKNFSSNVTGFLKDTYLKNETAVDLTNGTDYHFTINSDSASFVSDRFMIVFKTTSVLPVTLTHIKAYTKDKGIQVDWTAETEINIGKYEVEKSLDGEHFASSATIRVKANNGVTQNYGWLDDSIAIGNNYYRIKVTELSGAIKYSEIVVVNINGGKSSITIYPNPVKGNTIAVHMNNMKKGRYMVNLYNGLGQKMHSTIINHNGGNATYQIMTRNVISKGAYRLHITDGESQMTETVLFE